MRIHEPRFDPSVALFIIWRRPREGGMEAVAAGSLRAMRAAWDAVQQDHPRDDLTLQQGARVLMERGPL